MLQVADLNVYYGAIHALKGVSLRVEEGEVVTLIGANGAGKSTLLKTVSGLLRAQGGSISFAGRDIGSVPAHVIVESGVAHVPEGRRIFANLTVLENLELGAYSRRDPRAVAEDLEKVLTIFPRLSERRRQLGGTLSGGEQQMLATGRALMTHPRLMLMDEPSMGLAPILVKEIFRIIRDINRLGTTILLVEQNAHMALSVAHRAYVLETGRIVLEGTAADLARSQEVQKAYLGGS